MPPAIWPRLPSAGQGACALGLSPGPALDRVLPALQALRLDHPNVTVEVVVALSDQLCSQLLAGRLDFAVGRLPEGPRAEPLAFQAMEGEPIALIARRGHPLLRRAVPLTPEQVLDCDWIMPGPDSILTRAVIARLQSLGLPKPRQRILTASFMLTLAILQHSDAVAAVSRSNAPQFATGDAAAFDLLPLDLQIEVEVFGLITRERVSLTPASQRLADAILHATEPD